MNNQIIDIQYSRIFGCGNPFFGDDGFGPAVIDHLVRNYRLPDTVIACDAGTGICSYLFDILLSPEETKDICIVDAVSMDGRHAGELFEIGVKQIPLIKAADFALHQFPSVSLLREIKYHTNINVLVLAVQAGNIPDTVRPGLSPEVEKAVVRACNWLYKRFGRDDDADERNIKIKGKNRCFQTQ